MGWFPKDKVVVPVDFSDESLAAVETALEFVAGPSHLYVIHVLPPLTVNDPAVLWQVTTEASAKQHVRQTLDEKLAGAKYQGHHVAVAFGSPGVRIAEYAEEIGAELIVLPSHGRTGLKRLLIGSVAERVVRHAHCPVLVLRDAAE